MITLAHSKLLTLSDTIAVVEGEAVSLSPETKRLLLERRAQIVRSLTESNRPAYGFNRGFGHNVDRAVAPQELAELQRNFMRSHASGVGPPASRAVVRATMLLRAQSLTRGHSGIRPEVVEALLAFLNHGITPVVPEFGSVGASGDLAPLSHIGLALLGEGECFVKDEAAPIPTAQALARYGLKPLVLEMKEGLALSNGLQFSTACGVIACQQLRDLLKTEALATALTAQVMLASDAPFSADLHELRPHRGAKKVAGWIWDAMQESPLRNVHRDYAVDAEVQDPYNLRCAPQILGACYDLIEEAAETLTTEINSATDNPLLLSDEHGEYSRVVSGGHFHGMPVAVKLYNLIQAATIMASLINARCSRYIDGARNKGLGNDLIWPDLSAAERSISSGMMIPEYVSAALANALVGLSSPSHLFSISTNAGQEDHVSMSAGIAVRLKDVIARLSEVIAIELAYATQAAAIRRHVKAIPSKHSPEAQRDVDKAVSKLVSLVKKKVGNPKFTPQVEIKLQFNVPEEYVRLSPVSERLISRIGEIFPPVKEDRVFSLELRRLAEMVVSGDLVREATKLLRSLEDA
jgi:histidine ammonia-lyase